MSDETKNTQQQQQQPNDTKPDDQPSPEDKTVTIPTEEWQAMQDKLNQLTLAYETFGQQATQPAAQPPEPPGPTVDEQLAALDDKIETIEVQIDEALENNQPTRELRAKLRKLERERTTLEIRAREIEPFKAVGIQTLQSVTSQVVKTEMPHLKIPEIKKSYEQLLSQMDPSAAMNPEAHRAAYNYAVGQNIDKIVAAEIEAQIRQRTESQTQDSTTTTGRQTSTQTDEIPKPEEVLGKDALLALRAKGQSVDSYFKSLGYDSWADAWEKDWKHYYYEGEEGEA